MYVDVLPAPVTAPSKTEPTRIDVLEHAKEIALQQGAVKDVIDFWETEAGVRIKGPPRRATLSDYRHCRVCVAGAVVLAAVRLGHEDDSNWRWYEDAKRAAGARNCHDLQSIEDNPGEIVRILDLMIEAERGAAY